MLISYSEHWRRKKKYRSDIEDSLIEYAVTNSPILKDKCFDDLLNAITRVPPSGRLLKVVYKRLAKDKIKVITAYWLD